MPFRDVPNYGTGHTQIQKAHIVDGGDCHNPYTVGNVAQTVDDKWHQEEADRHRGRCGDPIGQDASGNVPCTQLQLKASLFSGGDENGPNLEGFKKTPSRQGTHK
jgi:hypothetical protein